eukprot:352701-Chlamydomonas_euryale.AAC.6
MRVSCYGGCPGRPIMPVCIWHARGAGQLISFRAIKKLPHGVAWNCAPQKSATMWRHECFCKLRFTPAPRLFLPDFPTVNCFGCSNIIGNRRGWKTHMRVDRATDASLPCCKQHRLYFCRVEWGLYQPLLGSDSGLTTRLTTSE